MSLRNELWWNWAFCGEFLKKNNLNKINVTFILKKASLRWENETNGFGETVHPSP